MASTLKLMLLTTLIGCDKPIEQSHDVYPLADTYTKIDVPKNVAPLPPSTCRVGKRDGICISINECETESVAHRIDSEPEQESKRGYCIGPVNIQCCVDKIVIKVPVPQQVYYRSSGGGGNSDSYQDLEDRVDELENKLEEAGIDPD